MIPRAADGPIIRAADERRRAHRYLGAVRVDRAQLIDLAIALPIAALGVLEALGRENTGRWLVAAAVNGAAVAFRRRSPLLALIAVVAVQGLAHDDDLRHRPAVAVPGRADPDVHGRLRAAACAPRCSGYRDRRRLRGGRLRQRAASSAIVQAVAQCGFYLLAWGIGRIVRGQEERRAAAERHVVRVELEREEQARSAVVEERARIARELHDAVAHSVSVMVLQAGGVRRLLGADPDREREREALIGIEETGRQAVGELHRMLGILRKSEPELAPSPSLRRVDELVEQVRGAGLDATLEVQGEPAELAPGVDMSAYRIVQEALTNALRYAPGASVGVTVTYGRELRARGPRRRRALQRRRAATPGSGHGIVGMRERAALFGGELEAGPAAGGGFLVRARLPL